MPAAVGEAGGGGGGGGDAGGSFGLRLFRLCCCLVFLARGRTFWSGDSPLSALLWSEGLLARPLGWVGVSWEAYAAVSDAWIQGLNRAMAVLFLGCAVAAWTARPGRRGALALLALGAAGLFVFALCRWIEGAYAVGMLLEYAVLWCCPLLLLAALRWGGTSVAVRRIARWSVAATFVGHGLYAAGIHPQPNSYLYMVSRVLGWEEEVARPFLVVVGYLDFVAAALLFVPRAWAAVPAQVYCVAWGLLTALARVLAHLTVAERFYGLDPWLFETLVRVPHGLVPLVLFAAAERWGRRGGDVGGAEAETET